MVAAIIKYTKWLDFILCNVEINAQFGSRGDKNHTDCKKSEDLLTEALLDLASRLQAHPEVIQFEIDLVHFGHLQQGWGPGIHEQPLRLLG